MKKIKVLHFELDSNPGGIESFVLNMYSQMDKEKYQFDFVTRSNNAAKSDELKRLGANIYVVSGLKRPFAYYKEIKEIMLSGYDIIHIHKNSAANIIPFMAAKSTPDFPVIAHAHNTAPSVGGLTKILHKINRKKLLNYSDVKLACSEQAGYWMFGENSHFEVIRNGIDTSKYLYNEGCRKKIRNELQIGMNSTVYGHVGRFTEQKNHRYLIKVFECIQSMKDDSYLLLIGEGPLRETLEKECKNKKIRGRIKFLGIRSDVSEIMQAMDYFLMPSLYEGLPIAAIEAQASGLRTILADTISSEAKITEAVSWIKIENPMSTASKICKISKITDRIAINKKVVEAGFDAVVSAKRLERLYNEMLKKKRTTQ